MEEKIDEESKKKIKKTVKFANEIEKKFEKIFDTKNFKKIRTLCVDLADINEASKELIKYIKEFNKLLLIDHEGAADYLVEIETELDHIRWHSKEAKPKIDAACSFFYGDENNNKDEKDYKKALKILNKSSYAEAIEAYKKIDHGSEFFPAVLNDIGLCYLHLKKYNESRFFFEESIKIDHENWVPYYNLAITFVHEKKYKEAISYFEDALRLNASVDVYFDCALNYKRVKDRKLLIETYQKGIKKFPQDKGLVEAFELESKRMIGK